MMIKMRMTKVMKMMTPTKMRMILRKMMKKESMTMRKMQKMKMMSLIETRIAN